MKNGMCMIFTFLLLIVFNKAVLAQEDKEENQQTAEVDSSAQNTQSSDVGQKKRLCPTDPNIVQKRRTEFFSQGVGQTTSGKPSEAVTTGP